MDGWQAILIGVGVVTVALVREIVRWRGRRWHRNGPRGTDA